MIQFTDHSTGLPVFIRAKAVLAVQPLPAYVSEFTHTAVPARVRIDYENGNSLLVSESIETVRERLGL